MCLGCVDLLSDDVGGGGIEAEKPRLQAGGDEALVEPEREVIVVGGHRETGQDYSRASGMDNDPRDMTVAAARQHRLS